MNNKIFQNVIIGGGPAGMTALLFLLRSKIDVLSVVSKLGGQIFDTYSVDNYPGFHNVTGEDLIKTIYTKIQNYNPNIVFGFVENIVKKNDIFFINLSNGTIIKSKTILLCTGANNKFLEIEHEKDLYASNIFTCANCDAEITFNQNTAVIGGGNKGVEDALLLSKYAKHVFLVHKYNKLKAEQILINKLYLCKNVTIILEDSIKRLVVYRDDANNLKLKGIELLSGKNIDVMSIFLAIGSTPNSNLVKNIASLDKKGFVLTKDFMSVNCKGLFAAGEVSDPKYRQMITSCGFGCSAALEIINFLNHFTI